MIGEHKISAVLLAFERKRWVEIVLDKLASLPVDEVVVVDHGNDGTSGMVDTRGGAVRAVPVGKNLGIGGRNVGAREATGDLLLMLDDDAYPLPGAIESLVATFDSDPKVAIVGGFVRDVDDHGNILKATGLGDFDWFLRAGQTGSPIEGLPSFFFPEGACMARREAFLEVGGYFGPFFGEVTELELATRLIGRGWDVRYQPAAHFDHMKAQLSRSLKSKLKLRTRNDIWYFLMHFPASLAARRIVTYMLFDLIECTYRGHLGSWWAGVRDAWSKRRVAKAARTPLSREQLRRAEMNRGRLHMKLLWGQLVRRLTRAGRPPPPGR